MLLSIALVLAQATTSFDVAGIHVILRQNAANNVIAANLYLLGGARQVTEANAGIEPVILDVSERGTTHYPKASLRRAMSRLGSEIVDAATADWTMFGIRSSTEVFDSTWSIFADRVMYPALAQADVNLVKAQYLSGIRQRRDDPDATAEYLADSITFVGHPYSGSVVDRNSVAPKPELGDHGALQRPSRNGRRPLRFDGGAGYHAQTDARCHTRSSDRNARPGWSATAGRPIHH